MDLTSQNQAAIIKRQFIFRGETPNITFKRIKCKAHENGLNVEFVNGNSGYGKGKICTNNQYELEYSLDNKQEMVSHFCVIQRIF
jgi:hypothetical protein